MNELPAEIFSPLKSLKEIIGIYFSANAQPQNFTGAFRNVSPTLNSIVMSRQYSNLAPFLLTQDMLEGLENLKLLETEFNIAIKDSTSLSSLQDLQGVSFHFFMQTFVFPRDAFRNLKKLRSLEINSSSEDSTVLLEPGALDGLENLRGIEIAVEQLSSGLLQDSPLLENAELRFYSKNSMAQLPRLFHPQAALKQLRLSTFTESVVPDFLFGLHQLEVFTLTFDGQIPDDFFRDNSALKMLSISSANGHFVKKDLLKPLTQLTRLYWRGVSGVEAGTFSEMGTWIPFH